MNPTSLVVSLGIASLFAAPSGAQTSILALNADPLASAAPIPAAEKERWYLDQQLGTPDWLEVGGHVRFRYETVDDDFRAATSTSDHGWFSRTSLWARARHDWMEANLEILDARAYDISPDLRLNTTHVNTLDILQANVAGNFDNVLAEGDDLKVTAGRHTMDIGSRRLVARNRYRNTINGFTGLNALWGNEDGDAVRAFFVFPIQRLPGDNASLRDNDHDFDQERTQRRFFGIHGKKSDLIGDAHGELYLFGIDEEDGSNLNTRNRELITVGTRILQKPRKNEFDYDVEAAIQFGEQRASTAAGDRADLNHQAHFVHVSAGYLFDAPLKPRLEFLFDLASGDDDPNDGESNRFDTLFGARRFEFGPTGIFGAFARANLLSPGLRLNLRPTENTQVMIADRFHYLASDQDAWPAAGIADPTGGSGHYIGNFAEIRVRWDPHPNLRVEVGVAHLFAGTFAEEAPNATTQGDSTYGYFQTNFAF